MNYTLTFPTIEKNVAKDLLIAFAGSILIALFAKVSIPLFFTPVPLVIQNNLILLMAFLLGRRGVIAVVLFVFYGCIGLPVFAGGAAGVMVLAGPTGGYIVGYIVAAYLVSYLAEKQVNRTPLNAFLIMLLGSIVVISFGCFYLSFWVGVKRVLFLGAFPFFPGDLLKTLIASRISKLCKWSTGQ